MEPIDPVTLIPAEGNKAKGEKAAKGSMTGVGEGRRKKLADISNLPHSQDNRKLSVSVDSKEYMSKLQQENLALVKLLAERNKIVELSGIELQKLRIIIQKLQQQNKQLAQANSQMLGELNSAKDRLKILQHELGSRKASLVETKIMSQDKAVEVNFRNQENGVETSVSDKLVGSTQEKMENNKPIGKHKSKIQALDSMAINEVEAQKKVDKKRLSSRRQSARFRSADQELTEDLLETGNSMEPSTADAEQYQEKVENKRVSSSRQSDRFKSQCLVEEPAEELCTNDEQYQEKVENKRVSLSRRSARFKSQRSIEETAEELCTDDAKLPVFSGDDILCQSCPAPILVLKNETDAPNTEPEFETEESRRSSMRPKRRAVEKILSYKEMSLHLKMRRSE